MAFLADWTAIRDRTCCDTSLSCKVQCLIQNNLNVSYSACHRSWFSTRKWFPPRITCGPFSKTVLWVLQTQGGRSVGGDTPGSLLWTGALCLLRRGGPPSTNARGSSSFKVHLDVVLARAQAPGEEWHTQLLTVSCDTHAGHSHKHLEPLDGAIWKEISTQ